MDLLPAINDLVPELTELRRELHQHPETRFEEHWTSQRIMRFLEEAGVPCEQGYAKGTGIVGAITGSEGGKTVLLRADMDGLEIQEETGLPYASKTPGRMHACGHDGHMAMLCGAAKLLAARREHFKGTVKLVFQPAEEMGAGGRLIVEEGVLDGVDAAFALHGWPGIPCGRVGLKSGPMMASADWFRITIQGRGCHGADPGQGVDPIIVAAHIVTALQTIVSREVDPWHAGVVTIGRIEAGVASNIIPETATLEGTFRALTPKIRDTLASGIERIAAHTAGAFRAGAKVDFGDDSYTPLINDPAMTDFARQTIAGLLGPDAAAEVTHASMTAEDFAFYLQRVPGAFLWLGTGPDAEDAKTTLHSPYFDFNDEALPAGVTVLAGLALRFCG